LLLAPLWLCLAESAARLHLKATAVLGLGNLFLLAFALVLFHRRPLGGRKFAMGALAFVFLAALLHLGSALVRDTSSLVIFWNLEQFAWSLSLFTFALAIGETSRDLFDRVFVRLQIAFILLASLMILVVTQTEKTEYLASLRGRSDELAEFVRAHVHYFRQQDELLPAIVEREDFLRRVIVGFGNLPELKIVRIVASGQVATFEIAASGEVNFSQKTPPPAALWSRLDSEEYFQIHRLPLGADEPGEIEFYGTREFLDRHIRKRMMLIFSLFTGMVALSTLMIGLVVRGAGATIRRQAQEIEEGQQRLMQASKLAAIGELAAGVAHEINNPATTILTMASFWLSQERARRPTSDPEEVREVMAQAQRIAQITRNLLIFSRPQPLDIKPVLIDCIIETSLRLVDDLLARRQSHLCREELAVTSAARAGGRE
jgi:hypothetical protein